MLLPQQIGHVNVPPLKIQGIKTKLVPFIAANVRWDGSGTYYEPFMGSGVVGFNLAPQRAVFVDINPHLVNFYRSIQSGELTAWKVRDYLEQEAPKLAATPADKHSYYYEVRDRFNETGSPFDFLFLQRSNFNGMMRFNAKGRYNVPFCRKPHRFQPALITKIVNQVHWVETLLAKRPEWEFRHANFTDIIGQLTEQDFLYLDPPYIDRHDEYFCTWSQDLADQLARQVQDSPAGYALSMWHSNIHRENTHLRAWEGELRTTEHFYHVGASVQNRKAMTEALVISHGHAVPGDEVASASAKTSAKASPEASLATLF